MEQTNTQPATCYRPTRVKVLYVAKGDNRISYTKMLEALANEMKSNGIYVTFTMLNTSVAALTRCLSEHFDIIFIDDNIQDITPYEFLCINRGNDVLTPIVNIKIKEESLSDQKVNPKFDDKLVKPFNSKQLFNCIFKMICLIQKKMDEESFTNNILSLNDRTTDESDLTASEASFFLDDEFDVILEDQALFDDSENYSEISFI